MHPKSQPYPEELKGFFSSFNEHKAEYTISKEALSFIILYKLI